MKKKKNFKQNNKRPKHAHKYVTPQQRQQIKNLLALWSDKNFRNPQTEDIFQEKYEQIGIETKPNKLTQSTQDKEANHGDND
jgi:hypothetical protein